MSLVNRLRIRKLIMKASTPPLEAVLRDRRVVLVLYLGLLLTGLVGLWLQGWDRFWTALSIPTLSPIFADMRVIQSALFSSANGYDPLAINPSDPWGRTLNYPRVWLAIAGTLGMENESVFLACSLTVISLFYALCGYLAWRFSSALTVFLVFTPVILLAVERGNIDMAIIVLVALSSLLSGFAAIIAIAVAMHLKLYPILLLPIAIARHGWKYGLLITMAAGSALLVNYPDLEAILSGNSAAGDMSYGILLSSELMQAHLGPTAARLDAIVYPLVLLAGLLFYSKSGLHEQLSEVRQLCPAAAWLHYFGASIHVLTGLLASNWDYRLMYLILMMPMVTCLKRKAQRSVYVTAIFLSTMYLWLSWWPYSWVVTGYSKLFVFSTALAALANLLVNAYGRYLKVLIFRCKNLIHA